MLQEHKPAKRPKISRDYENSVWGKRLRNQPTIREPGSFAFVKFRTRFRTPYPFFKDILIPECLKKGILCTERTSQISLELKVLVALRMLGRDACADDCEELSEIALTTCSRIFKRFLLEFSECFYDEVVRLNLLLVSI